MVSVEENLGGCPKLPFDTILVASNQATSQGIWREARGRLLNGV